MPWEIFYNEMSERKERKARKKQERKKARRWLPHEDKEENREGQHATAIRGVEHAKEGQGSAGNDHARELQSGSDHGGQESAVLGLAEDISVHKLPPSDLFLLFFQILLVVCADVVVEGPEHDHCHHCRQEHENDHRVDDRVPVDVWVRVREVEVPAV